MVYFEQKLIFQCTSQTYRLQYLSYFIALPLFGYIIEIKYLLIYFLFNRYAIDKVKSTVNGYNLALLLWNSTSKLQTFCSSFLIGLLRIFLHICFLFIYLFHLFIDSMFSLCERKIDIKLIKKKCLKPSWSSLKIIANKTHAFVALFVCFLWEKES